MRGVYKFFLLSVVVISAVSCSTDPLPAPVVGFTVSQSILEVDVPATFTNTTTNATSYSWDFGDGQTSDEESPIIFYEEEGGYTVTLTATTSDNQSATSSIDVTVGRRQLYAIKINTISFENDLGETWDTIDPDSASFKNPDLWFILGPNEDPEFEYTIATLIGNILGDLSQNQLSITFSGSSAIMPLIDADYTIAFYDFDGIDINDVKEDDESELMSFIGFNPVRDATPDENGEGIVVISQGVYSVEIAFKIE